MIAEEPESFLDESRDWPTLEHDKFLSQPPNCQLIKDAGTTFKRLRRVAAECDDEARLNGEHIYSGISQRLALGRRRLSLTRLRPVLSGIPVLGWLFSMSSLSLIIKGSDGLTAPDIEQTWLQA